MADHNDAEPMETLGASSGVSRFWQPAYQAQLLATSRAGTAEAMERLLLRAQGNELPDPLPGVEYLLFACAGVACAVPLTDLREALPALPYVTLLPDSPIWMLGIFPLRSEFVALIDPAPLLFAAADTPLIAAPTHTTARASRQRAAPINRGAGVTTALVIGEEPQSLALAVTNVSDIARAQEHETLDPQHYITHSATHLPIAMRYLAGVYAPAHTERRYIILQTARLLEDALHAIEEGHHHG